MSAIDLYARSTGDFESKVAHAQAVLQSAAVEHAGRIVQATSLGAEDMVITDLVARNHLRIAIGTLETGKLHDETVQLIGRLEERYGLQVEIQHIQCATAGDAQKILNLIAAKQDFAELARKYSIYSPTAAAGGKIPAFTRDSPWPNPAIRRAAFDLADGQISGIVMDQGYYHILKRVRSIPPKKVDFSQVKDQLLDLLVLLQEMFCLALRRFVYLLEITFL